MTDQAIENEIVAKGLTAPRVTPSDIEANIASEYFFTAANGVTGDMMRSYKSPTYSYEKSLDLLTFCVLVLQSGFTVTGESACASPENFDAELGRKIARTNAVQKIWPLMGYALKQQLHAESATLSQRAAVEGLQPHQQRVVDEKSELDEKATALSNFIGHSPIFAALDAAEQERLKEQNDVMWQYSEILAARIASF
jgi:hypothetical protein